MEQNLMAAETSAVKLFGSTLSETAKALSNAHLGKRSTSQDRSKAIIRIIISFVLLAAGVFFVGYPRGESQTIGATMIGGVIGYWLK